MDNFNNLNESVNSNEKLIQNLFTSNQKLLIKAYTNQNNKNYQGTVEVLESCAENFYKLGNILDRLFIFPKILREQRDILKPSDLRCFTNPYNNNIINSIDLGHSNAKPKQQKTKWTTEEEQKYEQGIDLYGDKSMILKIFKLL